MPFVIRFGDTDAPILHFPPVNVHQIGGDPYSGDYEATPTQQTQVFQTNGKFMANDFVVNPIPQCYGLITYNGFGLTVS